MTWGAAAAFICSAVLLAWSAASRPDPRLRGSLGLPSRQAPDPVSTLGRIASRTSLGARAIERLADRGVDERVRELGRRVVWGLAGGAVGAASLFAGSPAAALAAPVIAAGALVLPSLLRSRRERLVAARARREVPDLVDAVALGVSAGLTPRLAVEHASRQSTGALSQDLQRAGHGVALGGEWWEELKSLARRTGAEDLHRLASVLERSSRLGVPVLLPLRALAAEVRNAEWSRREERSMRAPVMMLFPLVFCILPAFVVAAVVPAMLVATRGIV